jgi:hypothetical protein
VAQQAGILEHSQVFGHSWLGQVQRRLDLTNTHHPMLKHFDNLHPTRVGQGLHDLDELFHNAILFILRNWNIYGIRDSVNQPWDFRNGSGKQ